MSDKRAENSFCIWYWYQEGIWIHSFENFYSAHHKAHHKAPLSETTVVVLQSGINEKIK